VQAPGVKREKPTAGKGDGLVLKNSRGDKTAIELFIAGIQGWEGGLRQQFENSKSKRS
jgi:hypothetical protein